MVADASVQAALLAFNSHNRLVWPTELKNVGKPIRLFAIGTDLTLFYK
jgi:hypothetical protein